jgi:cytochrome c-type biogenesis protein
MNLEVSLQAAVLAGIISFLSPCVLPLVPPYLCFITGATLDDLSDRERATAVTQGRAVVAALFFVLGFTTVFVALGATASVLAVTLRTHLDILSKIAGVFIILMGLNFLGVFRIALLSREARYHHHTGPATLLGSFGIGVAFAFGWTPCIGPVLAAILSIAASQQDVARGAGLLAVYSLGLGIPFLLAALSLGTFMKFLAHFRAHLTRVEQVMGGLLVLTGIMFLTGSMQSLSFWLLETFPWLARLG